MKIIRKIYKWCTKTRLRKILSLILAILIFFTSIKFIFIPAPPAKAAWYNTSWTYRSKLTIDHTKVSTSDQSYFVVLVNSTRGEWRLTSNGGHMGKSNGGDILFTSSDGTTKLKHEIEKYDNTTGQLVAWVQIPTVSHTLDTTIYIYYGNSAAADQWNITGTWDDNSNNYFKGVWHLGETSGNFSDSSSNAVTGTVLTGGSCSPSSCTAPTYAVVGQIGSAMDINAQTNNIDVNNGGSYWNIAASANYTVSAWIYLDSDVASGTYRNIWGSDNNPVFNLKKSGTGTNYTLGWQNKGGSEFRTSGTTSLSLNTWYFLAVQKTSTGASGLKFYVNGVLLGTVNNTGETGSTTSGVQLGTGAAEVQNLLGREDEIHAVNTNRSVDWLLTEYNNQSSPSTFFLSGTIEEVQRSAVLNFTFDEGYGTTAHDSSANGYVGTLSGATTPSWQTEDLCASGKCLYYQGSTAYISVPTSVPNVQSVSFWVKPKTNGEVLVDFDGGTHRITASGGTITASGFSSPTIYVNGVSGGTLTANTWQHIEVTTATAFTGSAITIGKYSSTYLNGFIDEFKIYDYARTSAQVNLDFNSRNSNSGVVANFGPDQSYLSDGLVGYWKMDEASGSPVDSSGNGLTLTNNGTTPFSGGKFGNGAGIFNGSSRYFSTATTISGVESISFWAYPASTTNNYFNLASGVYLTSSSGTLTATGFTNAVIYVNGVQSSTVTANTWQLITVTTTSGVTANAFELGRANGSYYANNGYLDEARVYNRTLSPSEILKLYSWAPGPVGYWKLDENTGTTANDSSGNGNSGSYTVGRWAPGRFGSGLYSLSNGVSDQAVITHPASGILDFFYPDNYTAEVWTKINSKNGTYFPPLFKGGASAGTEGYDILASGSSNTPSCEFADGTTAISADGTQNLVDGKWHHIACVMDWSGSVFGTEGLYLFVDGIQQGYTSMSTVHAVPATTRNLTLGERNTTYEADAVTDEARIYNYTRTQSQIIEDMNGGHPSPGSPVGSAMGYWKMDEGADNTCSGGTNDVCNSGSQGTNIDGAESNMAIPSTSTSGWTNTGKFNKGLNFDGANDVINLGSNSVIDDLPASGMTISTWIYPTSMGEGSAGVIMAKNSGATPSSGWLLQFAGTNALKFSVDGSTDLVHQTSNNAVTLNAWNHVVLSWDGVITTASSAKIYINGAETSYATTTNGVSRVSDAASTMYIGNDSAGTSTFAGTIDETKLYNFALTSDQIKVEYNRGSAYIGSLSTNSSNVASNADVNSFCPPGQGSTCTAPVGIWDLDENTGTNAFDSSGNGNLGTITAGGGSYVTGKFGSAYNFDALATVINAGSGTPLDNLPSAGMTVEAWVYPKSAGKNSLGFIVAKNVGTTPSAGWILRLNSTTSLTFTVDGSTDLVHTTDTSLITQNAWNHVVVSWDGVITTAASAHIYINGIEATYATSTNGATRVDDGTSTFYIGNDSTSARTFDGYIDNVLVYNYARTFTQVLWDYNRGGPIGWWKMDDCTGSSANDSSGNSLTGTLVPGAGSNTTVGTCATGPGSTMWGDGQTGKFNGSVGFDNTDDAITIAANSKLYLTNGGTISAWIYPNSTGENSFGRIVDKSSDTSATGGYGFGMSGTAVYGEMTNGSDTSFTTPAGSVPFSQWSHVAWVFNGTDWRFYVNGQLIQTNVTVRLPSATSLGVTIGNRQGATDKTFDGLIDDVRIYNYPLTAVQVKNVMNNNAALRFAN